MRVVAGDARGVKLVTPEGLDVRPTIDRIKEAVFSSLHFELPGKKVLDLFAGSGQLGIEALSRGAASCVFIEKDRTTFECVQKNLAATGLKPKARAAMMDSLDYVKNCKDSFDIVFLDPPYQEGLYIPAINGLAGHINPGGKFIVEHLKDEPLPDLEGFTRKKSKKYGKVIITVFVKEEEQ